MKKILINKYLYHLYCFGEILFQMFSVLILELVSNKFNKSFLSPFTLLKFFNFLFKSFFILDNKFNPSSEKEFRDFSKFFFFQSHF